MNMERGWDSGNIAGDLGEKSPESPCSCVVGQARLDQRRRVQRRHSVLEKWEMGVA